MNNQISLQGTLFLDAFKAYVEGSQDKLTNLLPIMSYQFPEISIVLKHKEISQLINFLKTAKERVSKLPDPNNIVAEKLRNINQLLNQAYLEEWERKYKQAYEINQSAAILLGDGKTELALDKYKQSIGLTPTEEAHVNLAKIYLNNKQPELFKKHIKEAAILARDDSLLPIYASIFEKIEKKQRLEELFLCAKAMIQLGSRDVAAYFEYVRGAVARKEEVGQKIVSNFPESLQKSICKGILLKPQEADLYFVKMETQITEKLSFPNPEKHMQDSQSKFWEKIDIFYLYLSRACANSFIYRQYRNYYLQKGLSYKPNSYQLLKQMCLMFSLSPRIAEATAEQLHIVQQALNCLQTNGQSPQDKIFDRQMLQLITGLFARIQSKENTLAFVRESVFQYEKYHQVYLFAAKMQLRFGDITQAQNFCQTALAMNPSSAESYVIMGNIECKKKQLQKAKRYFKQSLQISKNNFEALFGLAALYFSQNRYDSCIQLLEQAKNVDHTNIQLRRLYELMMKACIKLNKYEIAQDPKLIEMRQIWKEIAFSLGQVKFHKGQFDQALQHYRKAIRIDKRHNASKYKLILTQLILDPNVGEEQLGEMLESVRVLANAQKNDTQCLTLYGYLLIKSSRFQEAAKVLLQSIARKEDSCYAYYHLTRLSIDQKGSIPKEILDRLGEKMQNLFEPTNHYIKCLTFLASGSYQQFLYSFDLLFKYYKAKISSSPKEVRSFQKMFRRLLGNLLYLNALYPLSDDLILITAMLYRAINEDQIVQNYLQKFLNKHRNNIEGLLDLLFEFYSNQKKRKDHEKGNYFPFLLEFIFEELVEHHPWELMSFRVKLCGGLNNFIHNRAVNASIVKYLRKISKTIRQFKAINDKFRQQMMTLDGSQVDLSKVNQWFERQVQSYLRPRRAYSAFTQGVCEQIKKSRGFQVLAQRTKLYDNQLKKSQANKVEPLLIFVPNLVIVTFAFTSLYPFVYFEQDLHSKKKELLEVLTSLIEKLLDGPAIEKSQQRLVEYIDDLIEHYSTQSPPEEPSTTSITLSILSNLQQDELQSTIFSQRTNSSTFSLQPLKPISNCKQFDYTAPKVFPSSAKQPFGSSIIRSQLQAQPIRVPSLFNSSIIYDDDYNQSDFK